LVVRYGVPGSGHVAVRIIVSVGASLVLAVMIWYSKSQRVQLFEAEDPVQEAKNVEQIGTQAASTPSGPASAS
jgi:hypothetical protein